MENKFSLGESAWMTLFGEEFENIPDPNLPENVPLIKALTKEKKEQFKRFAETYGKALFERWQKELRSGMFGLLNQPIECSCPVCIRLVQLRYLCTLIATTQEVLSDK